MRILARAGLFLAAAIVVAASCIPDFAFRDEVSSTTSGTGGSAGQGGAGGAGGAGGIAGSGGAGGGGGIDMGQPVVPCGAETVSADCAPGEYCCYHETDESCDVCTVGQACPFDEMPLCGGVTDYRLLRCNEPEDCPSGQQCCVDMANDSHCAASCTSAEKIFCSRDEHCPMSEPHCVDDAIPYPGYKVCSDVP